ncbi:MAG: Na+-transporting NADH:ubiquinone oxidoreductase subunit [Candidatus Poribacteria bacterium]|nr:Na+-transporting NADH:ubiquinone oxidoreductase subunit [Candidatus Poribacteria bacterium]
MKAALNILIFCIVMGTASGALLVGVNTITSVQISKNEELKLKSSVLDVLGVAYTKDDVLAVFKDNAEEVKKGEWTLYQGKDKSVAFEFSGPGVWGAIYGLVCINPDHKTIRNIKILHQEETPGLGARIAEKEYLNQFKNKEAMPSLVFMPAGRSKANNEVDMITGATYSSKALEKLLNATIQSRLSLLK